jgi:hypothetical protein
VLSESKAPKMAVQKISTHSDREQSTLLLTRQKETYYYATNFALELKKVSTCQ